jgi:DNA-binding MarR family transcriptional regulator
MVRPAPDPRTHRLEDPTAVVREPLPTRFPPEEHIPALVTLLNGMLLWGGSRIYRARFGIGVNEWRILGELSNIPGATAARAGRDLGVNKAIVSRSIATLLEKGLIVQEAAGRARRLYLTGAGAALFDAVKPVAGTREQLLLDGFTEQEVAQLRAALVRMVANGQGLRAFDDGMIVGGTGPGPDAQG